VKADELLRKPFQPQDLIARVKNLLKMNGAPVPTPAAAANAAVALSSIFSAASGPMPPRSVPATQPTQQRAAAGAVTAPPMPLPITATAAVPMPQPLPVSAPVAAAQPAAGNGHGVTTAATNGPATSTPAKAAPLNDAGKLKIEIMRLEGLVKKLQSELSAEREYSRALEAHVKTLQESD
jgi:hypothetical protein